MSATFETILALWESLDESKRWGPVDYIDEIKGCPWLVFLGANDKNGGELYAVVNVVERRIATEEEFPNSLIEFVDSVPVCKRGSAA